MSLGHSYRWQVYNGTGVSVTCTVKTRENKFSNSGALVYSAESTRINAVSVATSAYSNSAAVDNSADLYLGVDVQFTAAPGASASGTVSLYLQKSTDGGTTWPSDGKGLFVTGISFSSSAVSVTQNGQFE